MQAENQKVLFMRENHLEPSNDIHFGFSDVIFSVFSDLIAFSPEERKN